MKEQRVLLGTKQFTHATAQAYKVIATDERGSKIWCDGTGMTVNNFNVEKARIVPFGTAKLRTGAQQDVVTCIVVGESHEKGYVGCLSGKITPLGVGGANDLSWAAHATKITGLRIVSDKLSKPLLWSCSTDGYLKIWEGNGKAVQKVAGHRGEVYDVVHVPFSTNTGVIWSCGFDKTIRVWEKYGEAAEGEGMSRKPSILRCNEAVTMLQVDVDQECVWSCDKANIRAWSVDTRNCVWQSVKGGTSITLTMSHVCAVVDNGSYVAVWSKWVTGSAGEMPPLTVFPTQEKCLKMVAVSGDRLMTSHGRGLAVYTLENTLIDPACEIVFDKQLDEIIGAVFRGDTQLILERVEPFSAAERCGAPKFLGWMLTQVNRIPVSTVSDVRAAVRKQVIFSFKFKQMRGHGVRPDKRPTPSHNTPEINPGTPGELHHGGGSRRGASRFVSKTPDFTSVHTPESQPLFARKEILSPAPTTQEDPVIAKGKIMREEYKKLAGVVRKVLGDDEGVAEELPEMLEAHVESMKDNFKYELSGASEHAQVVELQLDETQKEVTLLNKELEELRNQNKIIKDTITTTIQSALSGLTPPNLSPCLDTLNSIASLYNLPARPSTASPTATELNEYLLTLQTVIRDSLAKTPG